MPEIVTARALKRARARFSASTERTWRSLLSFDELVELHRQGASSTEIARQAGWKSTESVRRFYDRYLHTAFRCSYDEYLLRLRKRQLAIQAEDDPLFRALRHYAKSRRISLRPVIDRGPGGGLRVRRRLVLVNGGLCAIHALRGRRLNTTVEQETRGQVEYSAFVIQGNASAPRVYIVPAAIVRKHAEHYDWQRICKSEVLSLFSDCEINSRKPRAA